MSIKTLNIVALDDGLIIKKGGGSGGVKINNQEKSIDITENGVFEVLPDSGFTGLSKVTANVEISIPTPSRPKYTGHADAEGLRAIGWTDEDIAYYQENGVNWNEEDDQYHLVSDDNKALYGVLTADNISAYKERIVYLPKIDTSWKTSVSQLFYNCNSLIAIPMLDISNVVNAGNMFANCYSLTSVPQLNTSSVSQMNYMFYRCYSLTSVPMFDTSKAMNMQCMFRECFSLTSIPQLDTSRASMMESMFANCYSLISVPELNMSNAVNAGNIFYNCYSLTSIPMLDTGTVSTIDYMFSNCYSLSCVNLKNVKLAYQLNTVRLLSKDSLLYLINNEAAESAITITLASYAYNRWANDPDVVAALANHPNISLAK